MNNRLLPTSLLILSVVLLGGCYNSERVNQTKQITTTLGQEILDLKTALDQSAINESEYRLMVDKLAEERLDVSLKDLRDKPAEAD